MDREPPRYVRDRALPAAAYIPGRSARPVLDGSADPAWAIDLYNAGYFWEAHEVWELSWRVETDLAAKARLQGLILAAAACLKLLMGNRRAFVALAARGVRRLRAAGDPWAAAFADELAAFAADARAEVDGRPRLWI